MSEAYTKGPLDIAREVNEAAQGLDFTINDVLNDNDGGEIDRWISQLVELDKKSPHMGHKVTMFGPSATVSIDDHGVVTYSSYTSTLRNIPPTNGLYHGLTLRSVFDTDHQLDTWRVCHMLEIGSYFHSDASGNFHETTEFNYFPAFDSDYVTRLPFASHSLRDLSSDGAAHLIDEIVLNEAHQDKISLLQKLGRFAGNALSSTTSKSLSLEEINHQRASYLNSLGLLENMRLVSNDFIMSDLETYLTDYEIPISDGSTAYEIVPEMFVVANGYIKEPNRQVRIREKPEFFAAGYITGSRPVLTPLKSLIAVL